MDEDFAEAIRKNGRVILSASGREDIYAPVPVLRNAARGWGLNTLERESDDAVRRISQGNKNYPSAVWLTAAELGAQVTSKPSERGKTRWLNYYGRAVDSAHAPVFPAARFEQVLSAESASAGVLSNKIVIIHARSDVGAVGAKKDTFRNPFSYSWVDGAPAFGAEIHATALMNLVLKDWLVQMPFGWQVLLAVVLGAVIGAGLAWAGPWHSLWIAPAFGLTVTFGSFLLQWQGIFGGPGWWWW